MRIAITPGEPAGIGPDICIQLAQQSWPVELVAIADAQLLEARAEQLGLPLTLQSVAAADQARTNPAGTLSIINQPLAVSATPGRLDKRNAAAILKTLDTAITGCQNNHFQALVTGPVQKAVFNDAGITFSGHTEYLAQQSNAPLPVMMLACPGLRVALATTHLPLRDVAAAITPARLNQTLQVLHHDLQHKFGIAQPRILVLGLNPHAGESGHLGDEEMETITPVIEQLRKKGLALTGPLPADTAFTPRHLMNADAVLAMYHDQGLPVLKYAGFGNAVNVTLGLPFIRTSVDHGTALDLVGTGKADTGSFKSALEMAIQLCSAHEKDKYRHSREGGNPSSRTGFPPSRE